MRNENSFDTNIRLFIVLTMWLLKLKRLKDSTSDELTVNSETDVVLSEVRGLIN